MTDAKSGPVPEKRHRAWPLTESPQFADPSERSARTRRQRISPKVKAAVEALVSGRAKNLSAAAKVAGIARETFSRALSEPKNAAHLRDQVVRAVAISSAPAAARLSKLITAARSEHVQLQAVEFALGAAGISAKNAAAVSVSVELRAGFVIDLSSDARPMRIVSPEPSPVER